MKERVSDLVIEQIALGEYPPEEAEALMAYPEVRKRVEEISASNEEILSLYTPEEWVPRIEEAAAERAEESSPRESSPRIISFPQKLMRTLPAAAAVAVLVLGALVIQRQINISETGPGDVRMKGLAPALTVYQRTPSGEAQRLSDGAAVSPGDQIQLAYQSAGAVQGAILSLDGRGSVTRHLPGPGESRLTSTTLNGAGEAVLPTSYLLDDAPLFEKFFFITAPQSFDLQPLIRSLEEKGEINTRLLPRGYTLRVVTLTKEN